MNLPRVSPMVERLFTEEASSLGTQISTEAHAAIHSAAGRDGLDARIARHLIGDVLVLDLGCGDGRWLDTVTSRYKRAIGIDLNPARLSSHQATVDDLCFVRADLNDGIPVASESVDTAHANQVIEHVLNPLALVTEAYRVLRRGGVFLATTPNIRYVPHLFSIAVRGRGPMTSGGRLRTSDCWDDGHIHYFTPSDLRWIAQSAGFADVRTRAYIARSGQWQTVRWLLDLGSGTSIVQNFLSGNTMLIARK